MKMVKRKYKELEHKNAYGHGNRWFRVQKIRTRKSESVFLAILKKPMWRFTHFPTQMVVKSADMTVSSPLQIEKEVLDDLHQQGSCNYIAKCYGEELTTSESGQEEIYNMFLEYGTGGTLADLIKKHRHTGLPENEVRRYTKCILLALLFIHERGYAVRDLNPENIILVPKINSSNDEVEYIVKIGSFGSTEEVDTIKETEFELRGDVKYMSPEAMIDEMQLPASDIWALGIIVVEMLTGKSIWGDRIKKYQVKSILRRMAKGKCLLFITKLGRFSKEALSFLLRCLERNPKNRLTAKELLLEPFVAGISSDDDEEGSSEEVEDDDDLWSDIEEDYSSLEWNSDEEMDYFRRWNEYRMKSSLYLV